MEILYKELSYNIIGLAMEVHRKLGPGFLEKVYENSLMILLRNNGIESKQQFPIKVNFEGEIVGDYFADIFVDNKIILELKTVETINNFHKAQLMNYLKATGFNLAIIINFAKESLEYERIVLS